jgi:hemolysin-activating ACP:hemolysin acyltransferase
MASRCRGDGGSSYLLFVGLALNSDAHADWTLEMVRRICAPAFALGSYMLWTDEGRVVAGLTWTGMDEASYRDFQSEGTVLPRFWQSGSIPVVIDLIAPFGHCIEVARDAQRLIGSLFGRQKICWMRSKRGWKEGYAYGR